jgi:hypothetical protein
MMDTEQVTEFTANGMLIGGVFPFPIKGTLNSTLPSIGSLFKSNGELFNKYSNFRKRMYDPEQRWSDASQVLVFEAEIRSIAISSGRVINNVSFSACLSTYKIGYGVISFWVDLNNAALELNEIIELAALIRGTVERINPENRASIEFSWENGYKTVPNFRIICELIEDAFENEFVSKNSKIEKFTQFIYPLLYIKDVKYCKNSDDIINNYSKEIAGITDLWINDTIYLKDEKLANIIETDIHPFKYGLTCVSSSCTLELHPSLTDRIAEKENQSLENHHLQEFLYLCLLCEVPVAQFYILREYDEEISVLQTKLQFSTVQLLNPLFLFILIFRAINSTNIQRKLILSINELRFIRLTRKSYLRGAIATFRNVLGIHEIEESIDKKISSINNNINSTYSMLTAIFTLIISLTALIIALFQIL